MLAAMVERAAPDVRAHHVFGNSDPEGFAASAAEVGGALAGARLGGRGRRRRRPLPGGREPAGTRLGRRTPPSPATRAPAVPPPAGGRRRPPPHPPRRPPTTP